MYTSPTLEMMGASFTLRAGYAPQAADSAVADGGQQTYNNTYGSGQELGLTIGYEGLTLGFYGAERENMTPLQSGADAVRDEFNGAWYAKYSVGPVSIGYSETYFDAGVAETGVKTVNAAKTRRTAGGIYEDEQMSVAFNVNDNLSISYTVADSTYDSQDDAKTSATTDDDITQEIDALQVAYSMGGMSIKAYNMEVTNPDQDQDAADQSVTEIALGFAF